MQGIKRKIDIFDKSINELPVKDKDLYRSPEFGGECIITDKNTGEICRKPFIGGTIDEITLFLQKEYGIKLIKSNQSKLPTSFDILNTNTETIVKEKGNDNSENQFDGKHEKIDSEKVKLFNQLIILRIWE